VSFTGFEPALSAPPHMGPYSGKAHCQGLYPKLKPQSKSMDIQLSCRIMNIDNDGFDKKSVDVFSPRIAPGKQQ
jgi:hypothetical protein